MLLMKSKKYYIWFSLFVFLLFSFVGFFFPNFLTEEILNLLREITKETLGLGWGGLINFIFLNNFQSSLIAILFGIFLGIIPFFILITNGYVLGFVMNKSVGLEGVAILWKLVPHGIFEIPAFMISVGLGLNLGMFFFNHSKHETFKERLISSLRAFLFIVVPLLILAAIIEGSCIWFFG